MIEALNRKVLSNERAKIAAEPVMSILLMTADLATSSKVTGVALTAPGVSLLQARSAKDVDDSPDEPYDLVLIDLSTPGLRIAEEVSALRARKQPPRSILAFGPHVQEALLQAARDAGCDRVVSRGQFFAQVDEILASAARRDVKD